ncbi:BON domain-containing protein [Mycobacterium sp.]|uniref:channel-forming protein ArfA/OmpATb n=1 Tax=Mycobacterium sp. TaxID=1785 RepID=UPI0031DE76EE
MHDVSWWLMALALLLGLAMTFALTVRRVKREVPVTAGVAAGAVAKTDAESSESTAQGLDNSPDTTEWRAATRFYRRSPGLPWLIALLVVPLLLGVIGYGMQDRGSSQDNGPSGVLPTLNAPTPPTMAPLSLAPVSVTRTGNDVILRGEFPDGAAKRALLDAVIAAVGPTANVIDYLGINPDVTSLDFSEAAKVFKAAASVPDFGLSVSGDSITLTGTVSSASQQDAIEQAATDAWPDLNIVDTMGIGGPVTPTGPPGPAPAPGGR